MRVALLTRRFNPAGGGTERDLLITARYLRAGGHDVKIYANEIRSADAEFIVKAIGQARWSRSLRLLWFAGRAPKIARAEGADLILSFARTIGADLLRSGGGAHISYVRAARQWRGAAAANSMWLDPYHRVQMLIERKAFGSAGLKLAIAVSNLVREDLIQCFGIDQERIVTLYNGVDTERFSPPAELMRREVRRLLSIAEDEPLVIFIGNGFARKGLEFLLKAWPQMRIRAHLLVIGEDRAMSRFRALAKRLGCESQVMFAGPRADIDQVLKAADALALPSLFEPFGNVVMEALASGAPALVSRQVGAAELLPEAMQRYVVDAPTDPSEIAMRLDELLENREPLRGLARETAERYTWDAYGRRLTELLGAL